MKKTHYAVILLLGLSTFFGACGQKQGKNNDCQNTYEFSDDEIAYHQDDYMNGEDYDSEDNYSSTEYVCHEYVDLGLPSGTLWATCNVGANTPEGYGDYFAWGETEPKNTYNWATYKYLGWYEGEAQFDIVKYIKGGFFANGPGDTLTILQANDDAATANWSNGWCMPTKKQWEELMNNTIHNWTTQNGVSGMLFTSSNGNSIFLPAGNGRSDSRRRLQSDELFGCYWSSTCDEKHSTAYQLHFRSYSINVLDEDTERCFGLLVRPVRTEKTARSYNNVIPTSNSSIPSASSTNQIQKVYSNAYDGFINIRQAPQSEAPIVGVFCNGPEGAVLLGTEGEWKKIDCNGIVGYVYEKYVQNTPTEVYQYWGALRKDASIHQFTENDLFPLTAKELTYLRNSVYAKHGYVFKSQELNNYFKQFSWYHPNPNVTDAALNSTERANVEFIRHYQEQTGKTYKPQ